MKVYENALTATLGILLTNGSLAPAIYAVFMLRFPSPEITVW